MTADINKVLSVEDIVTFSKLTGDYHPLHSSKEYATAHGFKDVIAHGLLISSFSSTLIGMKLPGENTIITSQSFKYRNPAYPGDSLEFSGEITQKDARFRTIEVKVKVRNQDQKLVSSGFYKIKIRE